MKTKKRIVISLFVLHMTAIVLVARHFYLVNEQRKQQKAVIEQKQKAESKAEKVRAFVHKLTKPSN